MKDKFAEAGQFLAASMPIARLRRAKIYFGSKERSQLKRERRERAIAARSFGSLDCRARENRQSLRHSNENFSRAVCKLTCCTRTTFAPVLIRTPESPPKTASKIFAVWSNSQN